MFSKISLGLALLTLCAFSSAYADQMGFNGDKFYEEAGHFVHACKEVPCIAPYHMALVLDQANNIDQIPVDIKLQLQRVAHIQAQIWGDTILEGDYHAQGPTRLDKVQAFYKDNEVVGYKIQYSEKAWYTGECEFNGNVASLAECKEGRIMEESFVSSDMKTFFSDEENYAAFF
ncbi:MAG: hypothetical protein ACXVCP_10010 [Bdellovibrio sp.]